jgi:uncharacterized damage-inducible protein DinB
MAIGEWFQKELDREADSTRRLLRRVPAKWLNWRPHRKSMTMGVLAAHLAETLDWGMVILTQDRQDLDPDKYKPLKPKSVKEVLALFDKGLARFREALGRLSDEQMLAPWTLAVKGQTVFTMARGAVLRSMIFNHIVHHRGQLTVYLRLKNVPLPPIYGPTADENV